MFLGNQKPNVNIAMQKMAQQRLMRGNANDANLMNSFGSMGKASANQALSNTLRKNTTDTKNSIPGNNPNTQAADAKKRAASGVINTVNKSDSKSSFGKNILDSLK